jgi:hypothetical protein
MRYLWLIIREALAESLDLAQAILFLAMIMAGGVIAMLPQFSIAHHFQEAFDSLISWKGAALVLGAVVTSRLAVAPYRLWKREVDKNAVLEARLAPKIRLFFNPDGFGIQSVPVQTVTRIEYPPTRSHAVNIPDTPGGVLNIPHQHMATYVRIQVETLSSTAVMDCEASIVELERVLSDGSLLPLITGSNVGLKDATPVFRPGVPSHIDFLVCDSRDNTMNVPTEWSYYLANAFDDPATYRFKIVVGNNDFSTDIRVEIDWRGQWDTVTGREVPS